jgi:hypothetical protein
MLNPNRQIPNNTPNSNPQVKRTARTGDLKELAFLGFFNLRFASELGFGTCGFDK